MCFQTSKSILASLCVVHASRGLATGAAPYKNLSSAFSGILVRTFSLQNLLCGLASCTISFDEPIERAQLTSNQRTFSWHSFEQYKGFHCSGHLPGQRNNGFSSVPRDSQGPCAQILARGP